MTIKIEDYGNLFKASTEERFEVGRTKEEAIGRLVLKLQKTSEELVFDNYLPLLNIRVENELDRLSN